MKLFKIGTNYHLANLESIKEGDLILVVSKTHGNELIRANVDNSQPTVCYKVLATTCGSIDSELPLLDLVEINKLLGVVVLDNLAMEYADEQHAKFGKIDHHASMCNFKAGYKKCEQLSNKSFTLEDLKRGVEFGMWFYKTYRGIPDTESINDLVNGLLKTKTEWNAEVQTYKRAVFSGGLVGSQTKQGIQIHESMELDIDNGYVKILNLY